MSKPIGMSCITQIASRLRDAFPEVNEIGGPLWILNFGTSKELRFGKNLLVSIFSFHKNGFSTDFLHLAMK